MNFKKFIPFKINAIQKNCLDKEFKNFCLTVLTAANRAAVVITCLPCSVLAYHKSFSNFSSGVADHIPPLHFHSIWQAWSDQSYITNNKLTGLKTTMETSKMSLFGRQFWVVNSHHSTNKFTKKKCLNFPIVIYSHQLPCDTTVGWSQLAARRESKLNEVSIFRVSSHLHGFHSLGSRVIKFPCLTDRQTPGS